jgi:multidrug efflux pump subunit AcrA (membrane-fusion protein)
MFSKRVADAQRTRELLDDQIGYTTDALNAEVELAKLGYANNVDAKRKELEELQKQREAAIKKEEKALKAQQAMDSAMQASSLLTASAQIIAGLTKTTPLIGLILAVGAIAAMWATFAAAKVQAAKATKLAEGGTGTDTGVVTGRTHKQGGERFLDHVEVERGEMWGVLSRRASAKYGKQFNQIVTSFNKDQIPVQQMADVNNNILVDVSQTNERLDRVQGELVKLNRHFGTNTEVIETSTARIIKKGNKTRIIRK